MSTLLDLKEAKTLKRFAVYLGYTPQNFAYIIYKAHPATKYSIFTIPKRGGGVRQIAAPTETMKALQRKVATVLTDCQQELEGKKKQKPLSYGFHKSQSIYANAANHKNKRFVLNLDLADFFPSFNFGRVRGFFLKDRDFELDERLATVLAQVACYQNSLPQGSPCSPIIADLISRVLDKQVFAEQIVAPSANTINWAGFEPLLARISAVIADYEPPAPGPAAS